MDLIFVVEQLIFAGSKHLDECPAEKNLPIFLIVSGSVVILGIVFAIQNKDTKDNDNRLVHVFFVFIFAWWIAGLYNK